MIREETNRKDTGIAQWSERKIETRKPGIKRIDNRWNFPWCLLKTMNFSRRDAIVQWNIRGCNFGNGFFQFIEMTDPYEFAAWRTLVQKAIVKSLSVAKSISVFING